MTSANKDVSATDATDSERQNRDQSMMHIRLCRLEAQINALSLNNRRRPRPRSRRRRSRCRSKSKTPSASRNAPSLHPAPGELVNLVIDASDYVIGAVLQRRVNNAWQPLGFVTNSLTLYITKYSAYNCELLAVEGRNYVTFIDHKPFAYAFNQHLDKCFPRQFRHVDYIGQLTTDIRYMKV